MPTPKSSSIKSISINIWGYIFRYLGAGSCANLLEDRIYNWRPLPAFEAGGVAMGAAITPKCASARANSGLLILPRSSLHTHFCQPPAHLVESLGVPTPGVSVYSSRRALSSCSCLRTSNNPASASALFLACCC